jgi:ADP-heptose:LPS heptosyltransferase
MHPLPFLARSLQRSTASWLQGMALDVLGAYKSRRHASAGAAGGRRVLVVQLAQLGDFVLSLPLCRAWRRQGGDRAHIAMLVNQTNAPIAGQCADLDDVIVYDSPKYLRTQTGAASAFESVRVLLDAGRFTDVVWLRGDVEVLKWVAGARVRFRSITGAPNAMRRSWLGVLSGRPARKTAHFVEQLDRVAADLDVRPSACDGEFPGADRAVLSEARPASDARRTSADVVIHAGAGSPLRTLPARFFADIIERVLVAWPGAVVTLMGSESDRVRAASIMDDECLQPFRTRVVNACGDVPLTHLAARLQRASLYIGVDSGPLHIAAAVGVPVVGLYGPQAPSLFGPWGPGPRRVIYKQRTCSPCWQFACLHASGTAACLTAIRPEEVVREASVLLAEAS